MARSGGHKRKLDVVKRKNENRWSPEARERQKRRAEERKAKSLLESIPAAGARIGLTENQAYQIAKDQDWPIIMTGTNRKAVPKAFIEQLIARRLAGWSPKGGDA